MMARDDEHEIGRGTTNPQTPRVADEKRDDAPKPTSGAVTTPDARPAPGRSATRQADSDVDSPQRTLSAQRKADRSFEREFRSWNAASRQPSRLNRWRTGCIAKPACLESQLSPRS